MDALHLESVLRGLMSDTILCFIAQHTYLLHFDSNIKFICEIYMFYNLYISIIIAGNKLHMSLAAQQKKHIIQKCMA